MRYHSSVMDVEYLNAGQDFDELPDTYTIFITEKDFYQEGALVCPVQRMNMAAGKPCLHDFMSEYCSRHVSIRKEKEES